MAPRLAVASSAPGRSSPRHCGVRVSAGIIRRAATASARPIGRLMKKIACQPSSSVRTPPSSTPTAAPAPPTAPQAASAWVRGVPCGKVLIRIDSAAGDSSAAPSPWPARAANSVAALPASAAASEDGDEHAQAGQEHPPAAEQVGGASAEQQQAAEDQRVARDRPADVAAGDVQALGHVRHGDVDGRDVEDDHQLRDAEQQQQLLEAPHRPAGVSGVGSVVAARAVRGRLRAARRRRDRRDGWCVCACVDPLGWRLRRHRGSALRSARTG